MATGRLSASLVSSPARIARSISTLIVPTTLGAATGTDYVALCSYGSSDSVDFANVGTLLRGDGTNNSTTITDSVMKPATWSVSGNAKLSTSVKKYGTASISFDGTNSNIFASSGYTNPFGGNFTIEFWVYFNSITVNQALFDCRTSEGPYPTLYVEGTSKVLYYYTSSANRITGSALTTATWTHVAVCRSGTSTRMFVDGTQVGSTFTDTTAYGVPASRPVIGGSGAIAPAWFNGYMDDIRITSAARYTANFTAPTAALPDFTLGTPTLPTAVANNNQYTIKNTLPTGFTVTPATTSSQTIDGTTPAAIAANGTIRLVSDGSNWRTV